MARRLLWASLALAPVTWIVDAVAHPGKDALFILSALSLIPLAWLIGEATEHAGEHTGARIGGLLNASFGNAPELIIALLAIADNLPDVVRGSLAGSVVSNLLLVFAVGQLIGPDRAELDRGSLVTQLGLTATMVLLILPAVGWAGALAGGALADGGGGCRRVEGVVPGAMGGVAFQRQGGEAFFADGDAGGVVAGV